MVKVTSIDAEKNEALTSIGNLSCDYLVFANESVTNYFNKKDFRPKVLPLKRIVHVLDVKSHLIEGSGRLLNGMSDFAGKEALNYLKKMDIEVQLNTFVEDYDGDTVTLNNGTIETATVVWSAGVRGNVVEGIDASAVEISRILLDNFNKVKGRKNVFAIGDVAMMQSEEFPNGHPMVASVAIQQSRTSCQKFKNDMLDKEMQGFKYFNKGYMTTIGKNKTVLICQKVCTLKDSLSG